MTLQQSVVLDFISRFLTRYNHSPSYEEIAAGCGYTSSATIHKHMLALEMH
jgi:SOS-response transcriptional repressor LexA